MGCGSSFSVSPSIISKENKSGKLSPIISQKRLDNFEPFTLVCLVDDFNDNDQELRSVIDYVRCFDDLEECEQFILNNNTKNEQLFFIVSSQYATNIVSHIHDLTQMISIYILQQNRSNIIDDRWTSRYSKVKFHLLFGLLYRQLTVLHYYMRLQSKRF